LDITYSKSKLKKSP